MKKGSLAGTGRRQTISEYFSIIYYFWDNLYILTCDSSGWKSLNVFKSFAFSSCDVNRNSDISLSHEHWVAIKRDILDHSHKFLVISMSIFTNDFLISYKKVRIPYRWKLSVVKTPLDMKLLVSFSFSFRFSNLCFKIVWVLEY